MNFLTKWEPGKDLTELQHELNNVFGNFLYRHPSDLIFNWSPPVDIIENDNEFVVKAELPGIEQKDVKISLKDDVLTIKGEKKQEKEEKDKNFYRIERNYGKFTRVFTLSSHVKSDKVKATYKDGMLEINLPKAEEAKTKEIAIEIK